jgi:hypothetical protein
MSRHPGPLSHFSKTFASRRVDQNRTTPIHQQLQTSIVLLSPIARVLPYRISLTLPISQRDFEIYHDHLRHVPPLYRLSTSRTPNIMKFSSLLLLAIPLVSAVSLAVPHTLRHDSSYLSLQHALNARQDASDTANKVGDALGQADPSNPADCLTVCSMAALADSVSRPTL